MVEKLPKVVDIINRVRSAAAHDGGSRAFSLCRDLAQIAIVYPDQLRDLCRGESYNSLLRRGRVGILDVGLNLRRKLGTMGLDELSKLRSRKLNLCRRLRHLAVKILPRCDLRNSAHIPQITAAGEQWADSIRFGKCFRANPSNPRRYVPTGNSAPQRPNRSGAELAAANCFGSNGRALVAAGRRQGLGPRLDGHVLESTPPA